MFGTMVPLHSEGEYGWVYQKVQAYLAQHFTRLPRVDLYYDAKGTIRSESQQRQVVTGGLVIVQIQAAGYGDAIGLLLVNDHVELDVVSADALPELRTMYGYHDS